MPTNFDDRMVRAYCCAHSSSLSPNTFFSRFLTSLVSYDLRTCGTTKPTFDRKYWRQEAAFGCKYGGDAKIHIFAHWEGPHRLPPTGYALAHVQTDIGEATGAAAAALVTVHTHT